MNSLLVEFYRENKPNINGVTLDDIWSWDEYRLEQIHDYIQWMFPLAEESEHNKNAPTLTQEDIEEFNKDKSIRARIVKCWIVILKFWGLEVSTSLNRIIVKPGENFDKRKSSWVTFSNHNQLRMTRVIHCLKIVGLPECAQAFYDAITKIASETKAINQTTLKYWKEAIDE